MSFKRSNSESVALNLKIGTHRLPLEIGDIIEILVPLYAAPKRSKDYNYGKIDDDISMLFTTTTNSMTVLPEKFKVIEKQFSSGDTYYKCVTFKPNNDEYNYNDQNRVFLENWLLNNVEFWKRG